MKPRLGSLIFRITEKFSQPTERSAAESAAAHIRISTRYTT